MGFLTIKEYNEKYKDYSIVENLRDIPWISAIRQGMIEWEEATAYCWAGPWLGNHVAVNIQNHEHDPQLKSMAEVEQKVVTHSKYSIYVLGYQFVKRTLGISALILTDPNNKEKTYGKDRVSQKELKIFLQNMTEEERLDWMKRRKKQEKTFLKKSLKTTPHIEKPVKVYLYGNDDCSYTRLFETEEEAVTELETLISNPSMDYVYQHYFFSN